MRWLLIVLTIFVTITPLLVNSLPLVDNEVQVFSEYSKVYRNPKAIEIVEETEQPAVVEAIPDRKIEEKLSEQAQNEYIQDKPTESNVETTEVKEEIQKLIVKDVSDSKRSEIEKKIDDSKFEDTKEVKFEKTELNVKTDDAIKAEELPAITKEIEQKLREEIRMHPIPVVTKDVTLESEIQGNVKEEPLVKEFIVEPKEKPVVVPALAKDSPDNSKSVEPVIPEEQKNEEPPVIVKEIIVQPKENLGGPVSIRDFLNKQQQQHPVIIKEITTETDSEKTIKSEDPVLIANDAKEIIVDIMEKITEIPATIKNLTDNLKFKEQELAAITKDVISVEPVVLEIPKTEDDQIITTELKVEPEAKPLIIEQLTAEPKLKEEISASPKEVIIEPMKTEFQIEPKLIDHLLKVEAEIQNTPLIVIEKRELAANEKLNAKSKKDFEIPVEVKIESLLRAEETREADIKSIPVIIQTDLSPQSESRIQNAAEALIEVYGQGHENESNRKARQFPSLENTEYDELGRRRRPHRPMRPLGLMQPIIPAAPVGHIPSYNSPTFIFLPYPFASYWPQGPHAVEPHDHGQHIFVPYGLGAHGPPVVEPHGDGPHVVEPHDVDTHGIVLYGFQPHRFRPYGGFYG